MVNPTAKTNNATIFFIVIKFKFFNYLYTYDYDTLKKFKFEKHFNTFLIFMKNIIKPLLKLIGTCY